MPAPYIPQRDADARDWYLNFSVIVAANLVALGLAAGDSGAIAGAANNYSAAYLTAVNPSTRNSTTVAAKDAAKANASFICRPYAQRIQASPTVSNALKLSLGLIIRDRVPTRTPAPVTFPLLNVINATPGEHLVRFTDSLSPATRAKPPGAISMQLYRTVTATTPAPTPDGSLFVGNFSRNGIAVPQEFADAGKVATYFARWINRRGEPGPWGGGVSLTIAF
jgi:hypothetical protein